MNKWNSQMACVKCGDWLYTVKFITEEATYILGQRLESPEHMEKTCSQCGYSWDELPADHKETDNEAANKA